MVIESENLLYAFFHQNLKILKYLFNLCLGKTPFVVFSDLQFANFIHN